MYPMNLATNGQEGLSRRHSSARKISIVAPLLKYGMAVHSTDLLRLLGAQVTNNRMFEDSKNVNGSPNNV